ncbi:hypothetical protein [Mucilaginibacter sp.]
MKSKSTLVSWDVAFVVGVLLFFLLNDEHHLSLIAGLMTVQIFINCITNHIAVFKLTGKIY